MEYKRNDPNHPYDVTVIGGGPVGLFTVFYAGLRNMSVNIIESLPQLGGQLSALYPEKYIYDIAGLPKISGQGLIDGLLEQMDQFGPNITLGQSVQKVEKLANGTIKLTTNKEIHYTKTVIITAGNGAFEPRKLKIDSAEWFEDTNLHYFIDEMNKFYGKKVVLFGGGDSAVDWARMLEPIAEKVTLVHRRDQFRAHEHSVEMLKNSSVDVITPYTATELIGQQQREKVVIEEVKGIGKRTIKIDEVIVNHGYISSLGPIKDWGLKIEKNSIVVNSKMETNIEGIYAAGDICTYEGKVKLIATGFGEAPTAVSNAKVYIDPKARVQAAHSTSVMGKKEKKAENISVL